MLAAENDGRFSLRALLMCQPPSDPSIDPPSEDLRFSCPCCQQPLVVDRTGAGTEIDCPSCTARIQIPTPAELDPWMEELVAAWRERARSADDKLQRAHENLASLQTDLRDKSVKLAEVVQQSQAHAAASARWQGEYESSAARVEELAELLAEKAECVARVEEQVRLGVVENGALRSQLERRETELAGERAAREAGRIECTRLAAELAAAGGCCRELTERWQALETQHAASARQHERLVEEYRVLQQQCTAWHAQRLASFEAITAELSQTRAQLTATAAEAEALRERCDDLTSALQETRSALATREAQHTADLDVIEQQTVELSSTRQNNAALEELLEHARSLQARLAPELELANQELAQVRAQLEKLRSERSRVARQDQQTVREMSKVREQLSLTQFENERHLEEIKKLKEKLKATQAVRDEFSAELSALRRNAGALAR